MQVKNRILFDASALLTIIQQEKGIELLENVASQAIINSVNYSEVISVLIRKGMPQEIALDTISSSITEVIPFLRVEAELAGKMISETSKLGLSFGDRACLATGLLYGLEIYTTDTTWKELNLKGLKLKLVHNN